MWPVAPPPALWLQAQTEPIVHVRVYVCRESVCERAGVMNLAISCALPLSVLVCVLTVNVVLAQDLEMFILTFHPTYASHLTQQTKT